MKNKEIVLMGYAIQSYLISQELIDAKPKDLIPELIRLGFFKNDHREGLPFREVLRNLDEKEELFLIPQVRTERKEKNIFWFFNPVQL